MGGGLESCCVGRVYGAGGAVHDGPVPTDLLVSNFPIFFKFIHYTDISIKKLWYNHKE